MTTWRRTWISGLAASLALGALAACSSDEEPASKPAGGPVVPALAQAWTSDAVRGVGNGGLLRADDVVVVESRQPESKGLVGLDAATGQERWRVPAAAVCAFPERAQDGLLVIGYKPGGKDTGSDRCPTLAAVDAATGAVVWKRRIGGVGSRSPVWDRLVAVGDSTVSVKPVVCGPMRRYDLRTGKPLDRIEVVGSDGFSCDRWAVDGQWIAQLETPDFGSRSFLTLYDADTGERAFRRRFTDGDLGQILSADPLVIELSVKGHRLAWRVDPATGELIAPTGGQLPDERRSELRSLGSVDGVIVLGNGYPTPLGATTGRAAGLDPAGAPTLWSGFPESGSLVGLDKGLVVASDLMHVDGPTPTVVTRHAPDDVTDVEVLGRIEGRSVLGTVGDLLLASTETGVAAYRLPAPGKGPHVSGDVDLSWDDPAYPSEIDEDGWQDGEVRPDDVEDCPVSDETLTTLGFHRLDLPRPAGCDWVERAEPRGTDRELHIETYVGTPTKAVGDVEKATATEQAQVRVKVIREKSMVAGDYDPDAPLAKREAELPGVGDEAYLVQGAGIGGRDGNVSLLVRVANVVVHVDVEVTARATDTSGSLAAYRLEDGAWAAVVEVLDAAGLEASGPAVEAPATPALRPRPDLCKVLATSSAVSGLRGRDLRPGADDQRRVAGCAWQAPDGSGDNDAVQIGMYAVPSSTLSGTPGTRLARQAFRYTAGATGYADRQAPVPGLGDQARVQGWDKTWLLRDDGVSRFWSAARVLVRDRNLGVVVFVQREGSSAAALEQQAIALARQVLATQPRL
ncbi:PQQ-binding-like beta-propeller repeat protein [Nocardioides sp. QY071]|uniref:outer membrane protein assembly factor BamB family protein n=1 Tax=Nocardioides sp. QY071 TaxID=3044187 RepID=UPI00249CEF1A|nr:PQQ-binding-like beta-propeller repeat protein [Nocardioides sp. QY071]WGY02099.1 PQQ-binding-like beta-propeller repeat protein [Nocardioides sp. QY071]